MLLKDITEHQPDVRTYMPGHTIPNSCLVGVEVELEKFQNVPRDLVYWRSERDGSLREGGIEFVLRQPLTGYDLEASIEELYTKVLNNKYEATSRCSTHVHIDVRDLSIEHLQKIVFVYGMFERFIYDIVDPVREYNFYCTPMFSSLRNRRMIAKALQNGHFHDCPKYSGINLRTIHQYGSLEFRMHEGLTESKDVKKWIQLLMTLRTGTARFIDMPTKELLRMYSENTAEGILTEVFGAELLRSFTPRGASMQESMRAAQDLLLLSKAGDLRQYEMRWAMAGKGYKKEVPGIGQEALDVLRERRERMLDQRDPQPGRPQMQEWPARMEFDLGPVAPAVDDNA